MQQDVFGDEEFKFERKVYGNDVQMQFWKFLQNIAIHTFGMMEYKLQPVLEKYKPEFPKPNEAMIDSVIQVVEQFTPRSGALVKLVTHITSGHIAQLVLDLTHSYQANKNWNSHGNAVCAAMCNIAILVSALTGKESLPVNFIQMLPKGVPLGGQKHGWHDMHYVEYMMSQIEHSQITGSRRSYLDHTNFHKNRHNIKVKEIFNRKIANTEDPFPRPVWGNTVDFAITYRGAHLLDGECKSSENEGHEVLVFYSTQQLAWKKTTLSFLSSPRSMSLFKIEERPPNCG